MRWRSRGCEASKLQQWFDNGIGMIVAVVFARSRWSCWDGVWASELAPLVPRIGVAMSVRSFLSARLGSSSFYILRKRFWLPFPSPAVLPHRKHERGRMREGQGGRGPRK
jgi:hypothetical protein